MDPRSVTSKPYKRIILHAGLHKTGTTSIQDNCFRHRDWLRKHNIVIPVFEFRGRKYANHSDPIAATISKPERNYGTAQRLSVESDFPEAARVFADQFQQLLDRGEGETLLLSAELVCDFDSDDMLSLRTYLEQFTDQLQVLAFIRSPQSSLESMLQQRSRSGSPADADSLVNTIKNRYQRLHQTFSDALTVVNYHEAIAHPSELVGCFLGYLGIPEDDIAQLEFASSNQRLSMEAYKLIDAINRAYPAGRKENHAVTRLHKDIRSLTSLPGQPFQIEKFEESELFLAVTEEAEWLEQELDFIFPAISRPAMEPLWQAQTLLALESAINRLDNALLRVVAAETLEKEAAGLQASDPATAAVLKFISRRVNAVTDQPTELLLEKLGADYFKFAALQVERDSPQMALSLMGLALQLRPDADFMKQRIENYRDKIKPRWE